MKRQEKIEQFLILADLRLRAIKETIREEKDLPEFQKLSVLPWTEHLASLFVRLNKVKPGSIEFSTVSGKRIKVRPVDEILDEQEKAEEKFERYIKK